VDPPVSDHPPANDQSPSNDHPPVSDHPLRTSKHVIRIHNRGRKVIPNSIELHNTSSSIIVFSISYKKKIYLQNDVLRQRGYFFFDEHKNYTLVISPNVGYIKPGEKKSISLTFFFHFFVNTFGALTIRYLCHQRVFERDVSLQVDSFREGVATELWGGETQLCRGATQLRGNASSGDCSPYANFAHTKDSRHEGASLKNRLKSFLFYTKGRAITSASRFDNHDGEPTREMAHSMKNSLVKFAHPLVEIPSEGSSPNRGEKGENPPTRSSPCRGTSISSGPSSGPSIDDSIKKNVSESFHEAVKQYVITLVKSHVSMHGGNEGKEIPPLGEHNKVLPTLAHENEHYPSHTSKRGKKISRGGKGGESPPDIDQHDIAFAKDTFFNSLLRSFPSVWRKTYFATLLHMALEQALLTKFHSFYLRRYFEIIGFVRMAMLREKTSDHLPAEEVTVFIQTNAPLLRYIVGFVHDLYRSNGESRQHNHQQNRQWNHQQSHQRNHQWNHQVNHVKEAIFYFLSSAFLCIRRGVRNVIMFVDVNVGGDGDGDDKDDGDSKDDGEGTSSPPSGDFSLKAVFHSFVFPYVRAFLSSQGKTHYALHFVQGGEDVSRVCEAILAQRGSVKKDAPDEVRGMPTHDTRDEVRGMPTHDARDDATCTIDGGAGETPPGEEADFFKNFQADEDYASCFFFGESGEEEPPQGGDTKGNIVFVADRKVFARAVYEWHCGWLVGRVESQLGSAQVGQAGNPSAFFPTAGALTTGAVTTDVLTSDALTTDVPSTDVPSTDDPLTLMKKKTATGKMKSSVEATAKKQKKKNSKGEKKDTTRQGSITHRTGRPPAEGTVGQNEDHTDDESTERKRHPCTKHHLEKLFEILAPTTYILDYHVEEADRKNRFHMPEGVKVHVGMVATKMVNLLPFVCNLISVERVDKLHRQERQGSYFLYDYFVLRNRDRLLEAMRKIVHYVDEQGDISCKDNLFGKIPLPCNYDVGPFEQGEEKHSTTMRQEDPLIGKENPTPPHAASP
ncbi:hypothetical protein PCYB_061490, partial [Plasmodium cynomolgi strain B]